MSETTAKFNEEESASAAVAPPPPFPTGQAPFVTYAGNPNYPVFSQAIVYPQPVDPNIQRIHEYFPWSLINLCFGGFVLGAIAIILSLQTRDHKRKGDAASARKWSIATLLFNICVTLMGIGLIIFLIVYFVAVVQHLQGYYKLILLLGIINLL